MKLPRTLHIEGSRLPSNSIDPEAIPFSQLKDKFLVVEEKVDGTGVSIGLDTHLDLEINHRGSPASGKEFVELHQWANLHWEDLLLLLGERYIMFGEWMRHKHAIFYDNLPQYFLESDIYDKESKMWLSTNMRNNLLKGHEYIRRVPVIAAFKPSSLQQITALVGKTRYQTPTWKGTLESKCRMMKVDSELVLKQTDQSGLMEGLYIKEEDDIRVINRFKYIRYEFLQSILDSGTHLRDRLPIYNNLIGDTLHIGD